jgi:hypothetical protein
MSGDCGHGWGYHYDGASGICYKCEEIELLRKCREASAAYKATSDIFDKLAAELTAKQKEYDKLATELAKIQIVVYNIHKGEKKL